MPCMSQNLHLNSLESALHFAMHNKKYVLESIGVVCVAGWWVRQLRGGEETANSMFQHSSKMRKD